MRREIERNVRLRFKGCNHPTRLSTRQSPFGQRRSLSLGSRQQQQRRTAALEEQADRFPPLRAVDADLLHRRGGRSP